MRSAVRAVRMRRRTITPREDQTYVEHSAVLLRKRPHVFIFLEFSTGIEQ